MVTMNNAGQGVKIAFMSRSGCENCFNEQVRI